MKLERYYFSGDPKRLEEKLELLTDGNVRETGNVELNIQGIKFQKANLGALYFTVLLGVFLIVPLIFLFMDWFK